MGMNNINTGKTGEQIAEDFLRKERVRILARNTRTPFGELDIVGLDNDTLVFYEVKTRISETFGPPQLSITQYKKRNIVKNALYYIKKMWHRDTPMRIDVISVILSEDGAFEKLEHFKSAIWLNEI